MYCTIITAITTCMRRSAYQNQRIERVYRRDVRASTRIIVRQAQAGPHGWCVGHI